jgi:hypothetical protein
MVCQQNIPLRCRGGNLLQEQGSKAFKLLIRDMFRLIEMSLKVSSFSITKEKDSVVAAQIVAPSGESALPTRNLTPQSPTESVLDPELSEFCSRLNITPVITDFYEDEDHDDPALLTDSSSDIEEESELVQFTRILQRGQIAALKEETKRKRGTYLKRSKKTQQRRKRVQMELSKKGFLPLDEFMRQKSSSTKRDALTPDSTNQNTPEEDAYTCSSVNGTSEVESDGVLPGSMHEIRLRLARIARMESEESSGDSDNGSSRNNHNGGGDNNDGGGDNGGGGDNNGSGDNGGNSGSSDGGGSNSASGDNSASGGGGSGDNSASGGGGGGDNSASGSSGDNSGDSSGSRKIGGENDSKNKSDTNDDNDGDDDGDGDGDGDDDSDHDERVGDCARQQMSGKTEILDNEERHTAHKRLKDLQQEFILEHRDTSQGTSVLGSTLQLLSDRSKIREASMQLTKETKKEKLDVIVRARIAAVIGLLNLFADETLNLPWKKASLIVAKSQRRGMNRARRIREWAVAYLRWRDLPLHQMDRKRGTILDDEDIAEEIKAQMRKKGNLKASDVVEIVASPEMQAIFAQKGLRKASISVKTALRWLDKLGWTYGTLKNGMYLDGHEREDVVEYRRSFVERWMENERRFHRWDNDGTELPRPNGFPVPGALGRFRLILVTHDESTFFQNDERNTGWNHATRKAKPKAKGNGQSLMVSDFLTPDWGRLRDGDE